MHDLLKLTPFELLTASPSFITESEVKIFFSYNLVTACFLKLLCYIVSWESLIYQVGAYSKTQGMHRVVLTHIYHLWSFSVLVSVPWSLISKG